MMYRITFIVATIASLALHGYAASTATSKSGEISSDTSRILSILDFEDYKDTIDHAAKRLHTKDLEQFGSIADAFKQQFRDVIEEILLHAFTYLKTTLHDLKVKLLKKLGKYTVSELFYVMFDGVANFVTESTDLALSVDVAVDEEHARPSYGYSQYPYVPHPYGPYAMRSS